MDADRKVITWKELYSKIYTEDRWVFWKYIDFDKLYRNNQAKAIENLSEYESDNTKEYKFIDEYRDIFAISGDADITLSKCDPRYNEMHSFKNFSLMPCLGGMNDAKQKQSLVSFVRKLDEYYKKGDISKLYRGVGRPAKDPQKNEMYKRRRKEGLIAFLNLFEDVYSYCERLYFIDRHFVEKMLNAESDEEIMDDYWSNKQKIMVLCGVRKELLEEDINSELFK